MARKTTPLVIGASTRRNFLSTILALAPGLWSFPVRAATSRTGTKVDSQTDPQTVETSLAGMAAADVSANILDLQFQQISRYFLSQIAATPAARDRLWQPDFSSTASYLQSVAEHRARLRKMLGLVEATVTKPEITVLDENPRLRVENVALTLNVDFAARALLFLPQAVQPNSVVIAIPPEGETREQFAGIAEGMAPARWLTALLGRGVAVSVPTTIQRKEDCSLCQRLRHDRRRLLHRLGFVVGRTLTGLEVQQTLALRSFLASHISVPAGRIGVLGKGQGGMTALYAGAVDEELGAVSVLDYFQQREGCWQEPVDRMLYGQLNEFGDAEVAALITPRPLAVFYTPGEPGSRDSVEAEATRARRFYQGLKKLNAFVCKEAASDNALETAAAQMAEVLGAAEKEEAPPLTVRISANQIEESRNDHFEALHRYLRRLCGESDDVRKRHWQLLSTGPAERPQLVRRLHDELRDLMGSIPSENTPLNPRTKLIKATDNWIAYNVLLDVVDGVEAYGQLIIPKGARTRLPVVICQHGIGGSPKDVTGIGENPSPIYQAFAARLAERGYVTFAPYVCTPKSLGVPEGVEINPLVRQAAPVGKMRTSIELAKLHRIVDFLQSLPFVDAERIGYYGLSYGGYDAIWMPPLEPRAKLTVISGHFNDWRSKLTDEEESTSFMFYEDVDYYNWNVLNRFTHLELIASMWPRPVCIEWGIRDDVTPPAWHWRAWTQVEEWIHAWNLDNVFDAVFDGPHKINGVETFEFLDNWLGQRTFVPPK